MLARLGLRVAASAVLARDASARGTLDARGDA